MLPAWLQWRRKMICQTCFYLQTSAHSPGAQKKGIYNDWPNCLHRTFRRRDTSKDRLEKLSLSLQRKQKRREEVVLQWTVSELDSSCAMQNGLSRWMSCWIPMGSVAAKCSRSIALCCAASACTHLEEGCLQGRIYSSCWDQFRFSRQPTGPCVCRQQPFTG